ncbi:MAG: mercury methylation corrinoid protein HgcA [Clostridia bacterium]
MSTCCSKGCNCDEKKEEATVVMTTTPFLNLQDRMGAWKARWGIGRMKFIVVPGVYGLGTPDAASPVLVTANYKMSFDALRKELVGVHAWILVLDTHGINVWCAAGKGTFGTAELLRRVADTNLAQLVTHRTLVLPQLGAPGVSAHEVAKQSGFRVVYGPVRAKDVKAFLDAGMQATAEMRRVHFTVYDRLVLTPIELVGAIKPVLIVLFVGFFLSYFGLVHLGWMDLIAFLGAIFMGAVATPVLLPWVPGKAFAFKGWFLGMAWALVAAELALGQGAALFRVAEMLLILPAITAYLAMNFTGASTYTSLSGVLKEMKVAVPLMIAAVGSGAILLVVERIFLR